jgi:hypothetical protein
MDNFLLELLFLRSTGSAKQILMTKGLAEPFKLRFFVSLGTILILTGG